MGVHFGSEFFTANRDRLRQLFTGTAPIVITADGLVQRDTSEAYPFHQDRDFWYLTGITEPDVILVMDKGREYLIVPERAEIRDTFEGAIDLQELTRISGITDVLGEKEGWKQLSNRVKKVKHLATLAAMPRYVELWGMYANPARGELIRKLKAFNEELELLDLRPHFIRMRSIKQEPELEALIEAFAITMDTLKEVMRPSRSTKYAYEYEIEADITHGFRRRGVRHAFTPIVAGGKNACVLHSMANESALSSDELVTIGVGAEFSQYAADITRTISLHGHPSRRQEAVHTAVCEVQDYAYDLLRPGVFLREYEQQVDTFLGEKLRELGLIKTIDRESVHAYFPHRTSHFLGLDAHDAGDYERALEPGMVITVEPGIYIPEEGIGVRIEDDVLVTENGIEILTSRLPRKLA